MPGTTTPITVEHLTILGKLPTRGEHTPETYLTHLLNKPTIAVIGSRAATPYGEYMACEFGQMVAQAGATLLTDGSYGIAAAAMRGALAAGGPVVALQAHGISPERDMFPFGNQNLFDQVMAGQGVVVSTLEPDTGTNRQRFNERLDLLTQIAGAVVVVEASVRTSVLRAVTDNDSVPVYAVPGPATSLASYGPHTLIRSGRARLALGLGDLGDLGDLTGTPLIQATSAPLT